MSRIASGGMARPLAMSANCSTPPGRRTRWISAKAACLSAQRLITPLEITTSAQPSSTGIASASPSRKLTWLKPSSSAFRRDLVSISGVMSMPTTSPVVPICPAAMNESNAAPGPVAAATEQSDGVVGIDAVGATAVGDHLDVLGQGPQLLAQLGDRDRAGAGDVAGGELGCGPHVEHHHVAGLEASGELLAVGGPEAGTVAPGSHR